MSWRVARSLDVLLVEINKAAPNRSKLSDGSIGDAAHASRSSDHNPWVTVGGIGVVRARDFTHDPAGGLDCNRLAERLAPIVTNGSHPAATSGAYIIWNRRILSRDRASEGWRTYTGSNPHDKHLHLSVALSAAGFDSLARWGVMEEADPMADYEKQLNQILRQSQKNGRLGYNRDRKILDALDQVLDAVDSTEAKVQKARTAIRKLRDEITAEQPDA